jgi:hypothetical protein
MHDDEEITSDELDGLLDTSETLSADRPASGIEVRLYVTVDPATMRELERKAVAQGADLNVVVAAALRSGARAA